MNRILVVLISALPIFFVGCTGMKAGDGDGGNQGESCQNNQLTVTWDPPTLPNGDLDPVDSYYVYVGRNSRDYTREESTVQPPYTIPNLGLGTYFVSVKAFAAGRGTSEYSNEISYSFESCDRAAFFDMQTGEFREIAR